MPFFDELIRMFRARRLKITPQRLAILHLVAGSHRHLTAQEVLGLVKDKVGGVSFATVYNTLETLQELGIVSELQLTGRQSIFDTNTSAHHHFLCVRCGKIEDVPEPACRVRVSASARQGRSALKAQVLLKGTCPECAMSGTAAAR